LRLLRSKKAKEKKVFLFQEIGFETKEQKIIAKLTKEKTREREREGQA
jgi:hypothetical protein